MQTPAFNRKKAYEWVRNLMYCREVTTFKSDVCEFDRMLLTSWSEQLNYVPQFCWNGSCVRGCVHIYNMHIHTKTCGVHSLNAKSNYVATNRVKRCLIFLILNHHNPPLLHPPSRCTACMFRSFFSWQLSRAKQPPPCSCQRLLCYFCTQYLLLTSRGGGQHPVMVLWIQREPKRSS